MSRLSQNIANNIAARHHSTIPGERIFAHLTAMADGVGVLRVAVAKGMTLAADGIGVLRRQATAAAIRHWPGIKAGMAGLMAALNKGRRNAQAARAEASPDRAPRGSLTAQRRWKKALADMGKAQVRYHLDMTAHLSADANFTFADTGIMHGADRYPPRSFAHAWLGDDKPDDDGGHWRGLAIAAIGAMAAAGLLLWAIM